MAAKVCEDLGVEHLRPVTNKIELGRRTQYANALLHGGWPYVEGGVGPLPCPASSPDCNGFGIPTDWKRKGAVCRDVVIAFRGTDFDSLDDWLANHASCRSRTSTSGRAQIKNIVAKIERYPCYQPGTTIIATGHSLGGGLTQHAAYANSKIRYVYAFDPSLVTGFVDLSETLREKNTKNLPIGHVYEHGEILAYVRYGAEERVPAAAVRPAGAARALQRAGGHSTTWPASPRSYWTGRRRRPTSLLLCRSRRPRTVRLRDAMRWPYGRRCQQRRFRSFGVAWCATRAPKPANLPFHGPGHNDGRAQ